MIYYHLTTPENLESILQNGLKPHVGPRSACAKEEKPRIYLCGYEDMIVWSNLLNLTKAVQISDKANLEPKIAEYDNHSEYMTETAIPAKYLKLCSIPPLDSPRLSHIVGSVLISLSDIIVSLVRFYELSDDTMNHQSISYICKSLSSFLLILENVPWHQLDIHIIQKEIKDYANEGEYTFADTYNNSAVRLWEQLQFYPENNPTLQQLYHHVSLTMRNIPPSIAYLATGGWCK